MVVLGRCRRNTEVLFSQLLFVICGSGPAEGLVQLVWVGFITTLVHYLTFYYKLEGIDPHFGFTCHLYLQVAGQIAFVLYGNNCANDLQ